MTKPEELGWKPINTAPLDNERLLVIAQFDDSGELINLDWDAVWESECESWEIPEVYWFWASANGTVDEPTHWAYQDEPLPPLCAKKEVPKAPTPHRTLKDRLFRSLEQAIEIEEKNNG